MNNNKSKLLNNYAELIIPVIENTKTYKIGKYHPHYDVEKHNIQRC